MRVEQPSTGHPLAWALRLWAGLRVIGLVLAVGLAAVGLKPKLPDSVARTYLEVAPVTSGLAGVLLGVWQRYDAIHYLRIAQNGYNSPELSAFPPLYPILVGFLGRALGGSYLLAASLVSNAAFVGAAAVLLALIEAETGQAGTARRAIVYLAVFPTGFFLLAPYTESLFLLLAALTFHQGRRGNWPLALLAAFGASLTRVQGVVLALPLAFMAWKQAETRSALVTRLSLALLAPLAGFGAFAIWRMGQGFPSLTETQAVFWQRLPTWPGEGIWWTVKDIASGAAGLGDYIDLIVVAGMIILGVFVSVRLPPPYGLYHWAYLLLSLSQARLGEPLSGQDRFALQLFPAFIVLAQVGKARWANRLILYSFFIGWLFLAGLFMLWIWVE